MYNLLKIKCINMLKSVAEIEDIMAYVYVVEDDKNISEIESFALKNAGHTVVECASGKEFHKLMRDRIPDMILLDVMLPDEDGLEILRKIRQTPETRRVPVIMVTAKTTELDKVKGLDLGADDYITKPFGIMELISRVKKLPSTVILMPSTIPLLPGSSIYYTMMYAITSDNVKFMHYAKSTILTGLGISLGAVIATITVKLLEKKRLPK